MTTTISSQTLTDIQEKVVTDYCSIRFPNETVPFPHLLRPLDNEAHVATWEKYVQEAASEGAFAVLKRYFGCLSFPIHQGMSQNAIYRSVRQRGASPPPFTTDIDLEKPAAMRLFLQPDWAGTLPVITTPCRSDFVKLVQSFIYQNEPTPIPDSMGATMIAGFNNWDRIHRYRKAWQQQNPTAGEREWQSVFHKLTADRSLYQDRFLIVSEGSYSGVMADMLDLSVEEWIGLSNRIRLKHELTHYLTKRIYGVMHKHLLDEIIADYAGIVDACGQYRADWFLTFMGLEEDQYRAGGRMQNYCQEMPSLAFSQLCQIVIQSAYHLELFDKQVCNLPLINRVLALTRCSLGDFAQPHVVEKLVSLTMQTGDAVRVKEIWDGKSG